MTAAALQGVLDIPEADYFAATHALSASGIKLLLPPNCPAKFRWALDHPVHKDVFDFGSAAHKMVLGAGPELAIIEAANWMTKAAKEERDHARADGRIPILAAEYDRVCAMADAIRQHPVAGALFDPSSGLPEQSLFWTDAATGVPCRARLDWLPDPRGGRLIIGDYKTAAAADDESLRRAVGNLAYHVQAAFYMDAVKACGLHDDPAFVFACQEKDPPYLVNVVQLDAAAIQTGRIACRAGIERFRDCMATDIWPGYSDDITELSLPPWASHIPEDW